MNSSSNAKPIETQNPRNKSSITRKLSSFSSYLSSKSSHILGYSIELDEPLRQYGPSDTVKGTVVLNIARPLGVTHIVACLYGYVQVFKNHSKPSTPPRSTGGRVTNRQGKRWVSEYYGDGFASLFEEEIVLCGEGRLDPKLYHFRFEIDFPSNLSLPTSIDFERGTITYVVSSTITRPSHIAMTTSCDKKVLFRETIDVGKLSLPKSHEVTLRVLDAGSKSGASLRRLTSSDRKGNSRASTPSKKHNYMRTLESREDMDSLRHTSLSIPSSRSSSSSRGMVGSLASELRSSRNSHSPNAEAEGNSITVSVELSRRGCLPGEIVPLTISIQHTKIIQSLHGVIVTLYRQARVDMHPNLPVVSGIRSGNTTRYEDYYPRSKTGLGGLSLTAAGSSQAWRKDLSQTFAPLYIDPNTMSAEIRLSVRVPDEVFPSINTVPGEMISFKYFVEVIIDIHGKLANGPSFSGISSTASQQAGQTSTAVAQPNEVADYIAAAWDTNFVDTIHLRREKNAVVVQCDLTVGTQDSNKRRGKQKATSQGNDAHDATSYRHVFVPPSAQDADEQNVGDTYLQGGNDTQANGDFRNRGDYEDYGEDEEYGPYDETYGGYPDNQSQGYDYYYNNGYGYGWDDGYHNAYYGNSDYYNGYHYDADQGPYSPDQDMDYRSNIPIPDMPDELQLPEKDRLRRAEARLLPSQPPRPEGSSSSVIADVPTAPYLPQEESFDTPLTSVYHNRFPNRSTSTNGRGATPATIVVTEPESSEQGVGVQTSSAASPATSTAAPNHCLHDISEPEEEQELERRHHKKLAEGESSSVPHADDAAGPSVPRMMSEEEAIHNEGEAIGSTGESLPKYER